MGRLADRREIFGLFSCRVALRDASPEEWVGVRRMQNRDSYLKIRLAAYIFCLISLCFIISDLITGFYAREPYSMFNLSGALILLLSSLAVLILLRFVTDRESDLMGRIQFVYYMILETGFLFYLASDILRDRPSIYNSYYNMIVLIVLAVYSRRALIVLTLYISLGSTLLCLQVPHALHWERFQMLPLFLIMFFLCANYVRAGLSRRFLTELRLTTMVDEFRDISGRDFLTKLLNRTALDAYIHTAVVEAVAAGTPVAAMMVDIDDFKSYNDHHSHMDGDRCLHKIGKAMIKLSSEQIRFFRFGGEEFLAVGIGISESQLTGVAAGVIRSVGALQIPREDLEDGRDHVTVSAGCAMDTLSSAAQFQELLRAADAELYRAKRMGKACYVYQGAKFEV